MAYKNIVHSESFVLSEKVTPSHTKTQTWNKQRYEHKMHQCVSEHQLKSKNDLVFSVQCKVYIFLLCKQNCNIKWIALLLSTFISVFDTIHFKWDILYVVVLAIRCSLFFVPDILYLILLYRCSAKSCQLLAASCELKVVNVCMQYAVCSMYMQFWHNFLV